MPPTLRSAKLRADVADTNAPPLTPTSPPLTPAHLTHRRQQSSARGRLVRTQSEWLRPMPTSNEAEGIPCFTIDLSLPPEQRYNEVCAELQDEMRNLRFLFDEVVGMLVPFVPTKGLRWICSFLLRRLWSDEETAELLGISRATGIQMYLLVCLNVLLDLLMGCSSGGAAVKDEQDPSGKGKKMVHFRTLDWGMPALRHILVHLDFVMEPGGEVVASTITYAGFVGVLTGVRKDLSLSLNFRGLHNDMEKIGSNLRYYSHHLLVFLGLRQSISSLLRSYLLPKQASMSSRQSVPRKLPSYTEIVDQVSCISRPLPTSACYLCFCNGIETTVFEKDRVTAKMHSAKDFIVITNVDVPDAERFKDPSDIDNAFDNAFSHSLRDVAEEALDRKGCAEHNWRNLLLSKTKTSRPKVGPKEVMVETEDLVELVQKYPTTNEATHFACVMDAKRGAVSWCRMWKEPVGDEWIESHMSEGWEGVGGDWDREAVLTT